MRFSSGSVLGILSVLTNSKRGLKMSKNKGLAESTNSNTNNYEPIAIIGMGCRFPGGANSPEEYFEKLKSGYDAITDIPADRWNIDDWYDPDKDVPGKMHTKKGSFIDNIDRFDATFFGISPNEASRMDPQQRILLEVAYQAIEDAGLRLDDLSGSDTGVFVGIYGNDWYSMALAPSERFKISTHSGLGGQNFVAPNRVSYLFNLKGPSFSIDTACSSSMVAFHLACKSIHDGESTVAIAGGVNLLYNPRVYVMMSKGGFLSPDGYCKSWDARANGYVRAEGSGVVVLKPLSKAIEDGDRIHAVIRGTAINEDGKTSTLTIPNPYAQMEILQKTVDMSGIAPEDVQYVEAHGTGTPVGDPLESKAIGTVYGQARKKGEKLIMGSVKSNIGHLEPASGMAGLIKLVLGLKHGVIFPNLHFETPNPAIPFDELQLRIPTELEEWPVNERGIRIGAVNSFGAGGANATALVESYDTTESAIELYNTPRKAAAKKKKTETTDNVPEDQQIFILSAATMEAKEEYIKKFISYLSTDHEASFRDICFNSAVHKSSLEHRLSVVSNSRDDLREKLSAFLNNESRVGMTSGKLNISAPPKVAFVMSGQGAQWWAMGRQLLQKSKVFRQTVEEIDQILSTMADWSLMTELSADEDKSRINETQIAQPALLAVHIGLYNMLRDWGIEPEGVIGHSIGEISGSYVSGSLSLEDAVKVIFHRSRIHAKCSGMGKMLFAALSEEEALEAIRGYEGKVDIATINGPTKLTIAGDTEALKEIEANLAAKDVYTTYVRVDVPFHSYVMEPFKDELINAIKDVKPMDSTYPFYSTVTTKVIEGSKLDADYWYANVREPVRFVEGIKELVKDGFNTFIEISPHSILTAGMLETIESVNAKGDCIPCLRRNEDEMQYMLNVPGQLFTLGYSVDWKRVFSETRDPKFVKLPLYPFQKERHWVESEQSITSRIGTQVHPLLGDSVSSVAQPDHHIWEVYLDKRVDKFFDDHKVGGVTVFPAAGHIELAQAVARGSFGENYGFLEDINLSSALFLPEDGNPPNVKLEITSDEGHYYIYTKSDSSEGGWVKHSEGKINHLGDEFKSMPVNLEEIKKSFTSEVNVDDLYKNFWDSGLQYGSNFRGIQKLWQTVDGTLSEIVAPEAILNGFDKYFFHPVMLDSCFQSALAIHFNPADPVELMGSWMPIHLDRVKVHSRPGTRIWCYSQTLTLPGKPTLAEIYIFDDSGELVVEIQGWVAKYVKGSRGEAADEMDSWLYEYQWKLRPHRSDELIRHTGENIPSPLSIKSFVDKAMNNIKEQPINKEFKDKFEPEFDELSIAYIFKAFNDMGYDPEVGQTFTIEELISDNGIIDDQRRLVYRLFDIMEEMKYVSKKGDGYTFTKLSNITDFDKTLDDLFARYPDFELELDILSRSASHLGPVLQGKENPIQYIFSDNAMEKTTKFYMDSFTFKNYYIIAEQAMAKLLENYPEDQTLRILEIGAGTGGLTRSILPLLPKDRTKYVFTDISRSFMTYARDRFKDYTFIEYEVLDIEQPVENQGFDLHSFDILIASNVMHATKNLGETFRNAQKLLAPEGLFLLLELTKKIYSSDMTLGQLEGWWLFEDTELRPNHGMLDNETWMSFLKDVGYTDILPVTDNLIQTVFLFRNPRLELKADDQTMSGNLEKPGAWIIFTDNKGVSSHLSLQLNGINKECHMVYSKNGSAKVDQMHKNVHHIDPRSQEDMHNLLKSITGGSVPVEGVLFLSGLDIPDMERITIPQMEEIQASMSMTLINLYKELPRMNLAKMPHVWLVSSGVHHVFNDDKRIAVPQSLLWGFGRVALFEYENIRTNLVDLSYDIKIEELSSLLKEILTESKPDDIVEDEISFRGKRRYIHQLDRVSTEAAEINAQIQAPSLGFPYYAEIKEFGDLDSIIFRESTHTILEPDQVEIEVHAVGINYRDVKIALGLFTEDDVLESNGPHKKFGGECSGVITAIGENVTNFKAGDEVLALTEGALAGYAIADAKLVTYKPKHVSYEQAAAIPLSYLTAYYAMYHISRIQKGEWVLIHAAAWSVGVAAIKIAIQAGANVIASAISEERLDYLKKMEGIKYVFNANSLDFVEDVKKITPDEKGVDIVLNSLSGKIVTQSIKCMAPFGRFVEFAQSDSARNVNLGRQLFSKNLSYFVVDIGYVTSKRPELAGELFTNLVELFDQEKLSPPFLHEFPVSRVKEAFSFMTMDNRFGKVVVKMDTGITVPVSPPSSVVFKADATYMISGGAGGFGLQTARWMAEQGAKNLVLLSRSGPKTEKDKESIKIMENEGVNVILAKGDVTYEDDVVRVFNEIKELPPLKGVIHSAMVLDDGLIENMTEEQLMRVVRPKATGAWNLHKSTQNLDLDFFIPYSSISSVYGFPGQLNYNVGNSFLDVLSEYRKSHGLTSTTINWGALAEVGVVAQNASLEAALANQGWLTLSMDQAMMALESSILVKPVQRAASSIDWKRIGEFSPRARNSIRFTHLINEKSESSSSSKSGKSLRESIIHTDDENVRIEMLESKTLEAFAGLIGISSSKLDKNDPINKISFDSLTANQFRNWIKTNLEVEYSLMKIMQGPSIVQISQNILTEIMKDVDGNASSDSETVHTFIDKSQILADGWFIRKEERPNAKIRLFCFPYLAGGASVFNNWSELLPPDIEVYAVQFPGKEERIHEEATGDLPALIETITEKIIPFIRDKEFAFYGHSSGAMVSVNLIRSLQKINLAPRHLIVGGASSPNYAKKSQGGLLKEIKDTPNDKISDDFIARYLRFVDIPEEIIADKALMKEIVPSVLGDIKLLKYYLFDMPAEDIHIQCPITAILGSEDKIIEVDQIEGWKEHTNQFNSRSIKDGRHLFLNNEKHRQELCNNLTQILNI